MAYIAIKVTQTNTLLRWVSLGSHGLGSFVGDSGGFPAV